MRRHEISCDWPRPATKVRALLEAILAVARPSFPSRSGYSTSRTRMLRCQLPQCAGDARGRTCAFACHRIGMRVRSTFLGWLALMDMTPQVLLLHLRAHQ